MFLLLVVLLVVKGEWEKEFFAWFLNSIRKGSMAMASDCTVKEKLEKMLDFFLCFWFCFGE